MKRSPTISVSVQPDFWKKKEVVSFFLSIMVFFIHISSFSQYNHLEGNLTGFNQFLKKAVHDCFTQYAVPLYFIISGALFFRDYEDKNYLSKIKKRIRTLLIPYLIWNVIWMLFDIATSHSFLSQFFIAREKFTLSVPSILEGIFLHKSNGAFWFVFNLMVFVVLSPVIDKLIRNRYVGLAATTAVAVLCLFRIGLPEAVFFSNTSIVYYLIGAVIGRHYFDGFCKKSSRITQILSAGFLLLATIPLYCSNRIDNPAFLMFLLIPCAWAFWNAADLFVYRLPTFPIFNNSFAVYAMHINVSAIFAKLIYLALPKRQWMALPNFILTLVLTLIFIRLFCYVVEKISPKLYKLITGGR